MKKDATREAVVVLGATGGIGRAVVDRLCARGALLMLGARDEDRLADLAAGIDGAWHRIDAADPASIEGCITEARETFGRVNGIVNCLGTLLLKPAHLMTNEEWYETLQVNLTSCFTALRAGTKAMTPGGGSIVFISSAAARIGLANHEAIAAAKAGVVGLALAAAASYGHRGIRVNVVAPGLTATPLTERITSNPKALEASTRMHVLRRAGEPTEVASAIAWLLDPEQGWVTGQVLGVDGGLASVRSRG
jgi:NAD(P)-dependent dehydrogenase (short-subunit alcohol dehydrogenase family)